MSAADRARSVIEAAAAQGLRVALAESCTGGLIASALTDVPGASAVFTHGVVAYANEAKSGVLGVEERVLAAHGAVSAETAEAMAAGALRLSGADLALSVTGIAGPGGGSAEKPVGLVWFGIARRGEAPRSEARRFGPIGREAVRREAVAAGLDLLLAALRAA